MNDLSNYFNEKFLHLHIKVSGENCIKGLFPEFEIGKKFIAGNTYMDGRVQTLKLFTVQLLG